MYYMLSMMLNFQKEKMYHYYTKYMKWLLQLGCKNMFQQDKRYKMMHQIENRFHLYKYYTPKTPIAKP